VTIRVGIGVDPFAPPPDLIAHARRLEALGYDSIWLADLATQATPAPLVALAGVAASTSALKLGTGALVLGSRNPLLVAKELATVDALSGGRLLPTVAIGSDDPRERRAAGVLGGERVPRFVESIEIIRRLWAEEGVTHHGDFFHLSDATLLPRPAKANLELWLAGASPPALDRVGRFGDGWLAASIGPADFGRAVRRIAEVAADIGREIASDHYGATIFVAARAEDITDDVRSLTALRPELRLDEHVAVGPAGARSLLERFREAGASKFVAVPLARADELHDWLALLRADVVEPFER
jgi:probable F420-dependent oxidoreductase